MAHDRKERMTQALQHIAAEFFERESNGMSLITITNCNISPDFKNVNLYMTVLPESKEEAALDFARRLLGDLREYAKEHLLMRVLPTFHIDIDMGEKNRQKIDEILFKDKHK